MGNMQDAISAQLEKIQAVTTTAEAVTVINGEAILKNMADPHRTQILPVETSTHEVDDDKLAELIQMRINWRLKFKEERVLKHTEAEIPEKRFEVYEDHLRKLYGEKMEVEQLFAEEKQKLAKAQDPRVIAVCKELVHECAQSLAAINIMIEDIERKQPALKAKLDEERRVAVAHQRFLGIFSYERDGATMRYTTKGTPTPHVSNIKTCDAFLEKSIQEAQKNNVIVQVPKGTPALFIGHNGMRWAAKYPIPEGIEVCKALTDYSRAIERQWQKKLQELADKDVEAGLLLSPEAVAEKKKDPRNRYNIVDLVKDDGGFCFIPIRSDRSLQAAELLSYSRVEPEILLECTKNEKGNKKYVIQVQSVTVPQCVEDIFYPERVQGKLIRPKFFFDTLHEIATWGNVHPLVRSSLNRTIRWAESLHARIAVMNDLRDISRVTDLRTIDELADGAVGTAIISAAKQKNRDGTVDYEIGFEIVSDGVTLRPGSRAIDFSKKLPVYEAMMDGKAIAEFFARAKDGSFVNEQVEKLVLRNEAFELGWLIDRALIEYAHAKAERVTSTNMPGLAMLAADGGRDGMYIARTTVGQKKSNERVNREVGYVLSRSADTITFIAGLTRYSRNRLLDQGFAFEAPYPLSELKGFALHVLQMAYCKEMGVDYEGLPTHLNLKARAKLAGIDSDLVPSEEDVPSKED